MQASRSADAENFIFTMMTGNSCQPCHHGPGHADNEAVTGKVCREVGVDPGRIVLGVDIDHLSDPALSDLALETTVFAKVNPLQKARISWALKDEGNTVGYMGDEINDAAALRDAHVGISVDNAVDIAKESAYIIMLEKDLVVLKEGVVEGNSSSRRANGMRAASANLW